MAAAKQTIVPWQRHSCGVPIGDPERSHSQFLSLPHPSAIAFFRTVALTLTVLGGLPAWARAEQTPPVSATPQKKAEFEWFLTYYYQDPQLERVPEVLAKFLKDLPPSDQRPPDENYSRRLTTYFFGRVARSHPAIIRRYEALFPTLSIEGQGILLNVLEVCGDGATKAQLEQWAADPQFSAVHTRIANALSKVGTLPLNPSDHEAKTALELDLLWIEFFATSTKEPVWRLIDVLDRPDRLRQQLEHWLQAHPVPADRSRMAQELRSVHILLDADGVPPQAGDLDVLCARALQTASRKGSKHSFQEVRADLGLTDRDVQEMAVKGAAAWAIESNGEQHPKLIGFYEEELPRRRGGSRALLVKVLSKAWLGQGHAARAVEYLEQLMASTPADPTAQTLLTSAYLKVGDVPKAQSVCEQLARLMPELAGEMQREIAYRRLELLPLEDGALAGPADASALRLIGDVVRKSGKVGSYRSRFLVKDMTTVDPSKTKDGVAIEWRLEHVRPNRFAVEQVAWADGSADKWLSLGKAHYQFFGFWMLMSEGKAKPAQDLMDYDRWNRFLGIDKYLDLMRNEKPTRVGQTPGDPSYLVCQYAPAEWAAFHAGWPMKDPGYTVTLWVNPATAFLDKAEVSIAGTDDEGKPISFRAEQLVVDYGGKITIEKPAPLLKTQPVKEAHRR